MALQRTTYIEFFLDFDDVDEYRSVGTAEAPLWKPEGQINDDEWNNCACHIKFPSDIINDLTWEHVKWEESCPKMGGHSFTVDPDELPYTIESVEAFFEACAKLIDEGVVLESNCYPYTINRGSEGYYDPKIVLGNAVCPEHVVALLKKKA